MYETIRIVEKLRPKYVIWENVKNLLSVKHRPNFEAYLKKMEDLGYRNYYQVLNAKDYGVPQNRARVFTMSIRDDIEKDFKFPEPRPLEKRLKDVLEPSVDEKYYLSERQTKGMMVTYHQSYKEPALKFIGGIGNKDRVGDGKSFSRNFPQGNRVYSTEGIAATQTADGGGIGGKTGLYMDEDTFVGRAYKEFEDENGYVPKMFNPYNKTEITDIAPTQTTQSGSTTSSATVLVKDPVIVASRGRSKGVQKDNLMMEDGLEAQYRIRKLTPRETYRLMGFTDEEFDRAAKVCSNTQLYKQVIQ